MASDEPATKKAKTEEGEVAAEPAKPVYVEVEKDAQAVKSAVKDAVTFHVKDTTVNVMSSATGLLRPLTEGGMQYLQAGAKASVGIKGGRYMYEVKLVEMLMPYDNTRDRNRGPAKNVLKVGFGTDKASLFAGENAESLCFDLDGRLFVGGKSSKVAKPIYRDNTAAVLLNLDKSSPNANTVSLFINGVRACDPQALPEELKGKTLFPLISFRNVSIQPNFGPQPYVPLPFKCNMVGGAASADAQVTAAGATSGKNDVVFPVGLPDEGPFEWLDMFLEKNPKYVELSERSLVSWAKKSGCGGGSGGSKDAPEANFGLPALDDKSARKCLETFAPMQKRDYVVMDLASMLNTEKRAALIAKWPASCFNRIAHLVVGDPTADYVKNTNKLTLEKKQAASDVAFKAEQLEAKRKKEVERKQAELEKKKAYLAAKKEAEEKGEEPPAEPTPEEPEPEMEVDPPKVTLTPEETKVKFFQHKVPDMAEKQLNINFMKFTLPAKGEFDKIDYAWFKDEKKCAAHLAKYISDRKLTTRVEDIKPSAWFNDKAKAFNKQFGDWKGKQSGYISKLKQKAAEKERKERAAKAKAEAAAKAAAVKEAKKEAKKAAREKAIAEAAEKGEEPPPEEPEEEEKEEEKKEEPVEEPPAEEEEEQPDFENVDIFDADDICNLGAGMPLFKDFGAEDWCMTQLRFELYMLVHAFGKDCEDADRNKVHVDHLAFYYNKYYRKNLDPKAYGVEDVAAIVGLVPDTVFVNKSKTLETLLPEDLESYGVLVKIGEECRRYRGLCVQAGDEGAALKLNTGSLMGGGKGGDRGDHRGDRGHGGGGDGGFKGGDFGKGGFKGGDFGKGMMGMDGMGMKGPYGKGGMDGFKGGFKGGMMGMDGGKDWGKGGGKWGKW